MKKIIIFLIVFTVVSFISIKNTYASTSFYQAEYIPEIYLNKYNPQDKLIYYHQARMIRESNSNKIAYCLEPFTDLTNNGGYQETQNPTQYTAAQLEFLPLIAYFGYGYENHTDPKWYAITQMLIWKTIYPNASYYYTSTAKGEQISFFNEENEIYELINEYKKNISFHNETFTIVTGTELHTFDLNKVLKTYKPIDENIITYSNILQTPVLTTGTYEIILEKQTLNHNEPILYYLSENNQDVITIGKPPQKINKFTINVVETELNIHKLDYDTNSTTPQGEASIEGTILSLYTDANVFIQDIKLDASGHAQIKNLDFGTYYIKEKTPGIGYNLNETKYRFTLDKNNLTKKINIKNKVIKGTIIIKKEYGSQNNFLPEPNISFNIYNTNNELIKTVTTDENGIAEITLPYGKYTINQLTTTEGFQKVEPFEVEIKEENEIITKELKNYKIEVPNTHTNSLLMLIINFLKELLC